MRKKRILLVNEFSLLATGFSIYGKELYSRLLQTGKYELAELACYCQDGDTRLGSIPWRVYPNIPVEDDALAQYNSKPSYQWGEYRFEQVCLDFVPDVIFQIRDYWHIEFAERSPFRKYFTLALQPTIDAEHQHEEWLSNYANADAVFTYSDFALDVLRKESNNIIPLHCSAPAGANAEDFVVVPNKRQHKINCGLSEDALVIGTVMRNQKRKLYPDLLTAFRKYLNSAPASLAQKTFLYLHTAYPDAGWDIPKLIKENGIGSRTYFTYTCASCGATYPSFYADAVAFCKFCGGHTAHLPGVQNGVSRQVLGHIMNLFDVYVQYAYAEGQGIPQVEAAYCEIPCMAVNYSAMKDTIHKLNGIPINVQRYCREQETHCKRALPDNDDFVNKLINFFEQPEQVRKELGIKARSGALTHYSWERTAKIWEDYFDSVATQEDDSRWVQPPDIMEPNLNIPSGLTNEQFVEWAFINIANRPDLLNSYIALRLTRDLNWDATQVGNNGIFSDGSLLSQQPSWRSPFTREEVIQELVQVCNFKNFWERKRYEYLPRIRERLQG